MFEVGEKSDNLFRFSKEIKPCCGRRTEQERYVKSAGGNLYSVAVSELRRLGVAIDEMMKTRLGIIRCCECYRDSLRSHNLRAPDLNLIG